MKKQRFHITLDFYRDDKPDYWTMARRLRHYDNDHMYVDNCHDMIFSYDLNGKVSTYTMHRHYFYTELMANKHTGNIDYYTVTSWKKTLKGMEDKKMKEKLEREKSYRLYAPNMSDIQIILDEINIPRRIHEKLELSPMVNDPHMFRLICRDRIYSSYMTIREMFHYLLGWLRRNNDRGDMPKAELKKIRKCEEKSEYPR